MSRNFEHTVYLNKSLGFKRHRLVEIIVYDGCDIISSYKRSKYPTKIREKLMLFE